MYIINVMFVTMKCQTVHKCCNNDYTIELMLLKTKETHTLSLLTKGIALYAYKVSKSNISVMCYLH